MAKRSSSTKRNKKISKKNIISSICFFLVLVLIAVFYYYFAEKLGLPPIDFYNNQTNLQSTTGTTISSKLSGDLRVHVVDVGQGDGIIVEFPDGKNMLIDAGDSDPDNKLINYIDALSITKFDYMIATHQDEDHIGEMKEIFDKYEVSYVYRPNVLSENKNASSLPANFNVGLTQGKVSTSNAYLEFLQCIVDEGSSWSVFNKDSDLNFNLADDSGQTITCTLDFLTPTAQPNQIQYSDANDYSPIILLNYAGIKFLLTGDAETDAEKEFVEHYASANYVDIKYLKVGHHGSETSTSQELLDIVKPEVALISCGNYSGKNKNHLHPRQATLDKLFDIKANIYRTDLHGNLVVTVDKLGNDRLETSKIVDDYSDVLVGCDTFASQNSASA